MSIENMKIRLKYAGGASQLDRMNADKLKSLKKAMLYSYQSAVIKLADGREFRCLINPNKISLELDNKILSIPFEDYCLNGSISPDLEDEKNQSGEGFWEDMEDLVATLVYENDAWEEMVPEEDADDVVTPEDNFDGGLQVIGIKEGDVIEWKNNGSHWIIYLQRLEETAYFRAEMRRCRHQLTLGNGSKYWAYVRGPAEQSLVWSQSNGNYINKLNNTLIMYITRNDETLKYFSRFTRVIIDGKPWEVQVVDSISTPGILEISLKETYTNSIETNIDEVVQKAMEKEEVKEKNTLLPYIHGYSKVDPYENYTYTLKNHNGGGRWLISNESRKNIAKLIQSDDLNAEVQIMTGKSGTFVLNYVAENNVVTTIDITIESL